MNIFENKIGQLKVGFRIMVASEKTSQHVHIVHLKKEGFEDNHDVKKQNSLKEFY
jgi:hypothetical protein